MSQVLDNGQESFRQDDFSVYEIKEQKRAELEIEREQRAKLDFWYKKPLKDATIADVIADRYKDRVRHSEELQKWMYYDNGVWIIGAKKRVVQRSEDVIHEMLGEAIRIKDIEKRKHVFKELIKFLDEYKMQSSVSALSRKVDIRENELDQYPNLLNAVNCVIDLKTGERWGHSPDYFLTQQSPVHYYGLGKEKCEKWHQFLLEITMGDEELIHYLQVCAGYTATGHTSEHMFNFLYGIGRNGKSTFLSVLNRVLGSYSYSVPIEAFLVLSMGKIREDIAQMRGKRFVLTTEATSGKLNEELMKRITGGDPVRARLLHSNSIEFYPQCVIWMMGSYLPNIRGTDEGIWSRVRCIPFDYFIPKGDRIRRYDEMLFDAEASGILEWIVEGAMEWYTEGLPDADKVTRTSSEYRKKMDTLGDFLAKYAIADREILNRIKATEESKLTRRDFPSITGKELHNEYVEETGLKVTGPSFRQMMEQRGFRYKRAGGVACYFGISRNESMQ